MLSINKNYKAMNYEKVNSHGRTSPINYKGFHENTNTKKDDFDILLPCIESITLNNDLTDLANEFADYGRSFSFSDPSTLKDDPEKPALPTPSSTPPTTPTPFFTKPLNKKSNNNNNNNSSSSKNNSPSSPNYFINPTTNKNSQYYNTNRIPINTNTNTNRNKNTTNYNQSKKRQDKSINQREVNENNNYPTSYNDNDNSDLIDIRRIQSVLLFDNAFNLYANTRILDGLEMEKREEDRNINDDNNGRSDSEDFEEDGNESFAVIQNNDMSQDLKNKRLSKIQSGQPSQDFFVMDEDEATQSRPRSLATKATPSTKSKGRHDHKHHHKHGHKHDSNDYRQGKDREFLLPEESPRKNSQGDLPYLPMFSFIKEEPEKEGNPDDLGFDWNKSQQLSYLHMLSFSKESHDDLSQLLNFSFLKNKSEEENLIKDKSFRKETNPEYNNLNNYNLLPNNPKTLYSNDMLEGGKEPKKNKIHEEVKKPMKNTLSNQTREYKISPSTTPVLSSLSISLPKISPENTNVMEQKSEKINEPQPLPYSNNNNNNNNNMTTTTPLAFTQDPKTLNISQNRSIRSINPLPTPRSSPLSSPLSPSSHSTPSSNDLHSPSFTTSNNSGNYRRKAKIKPLIQLTEKDIPSDLISSSPNSINRISNHGPVLSPLSMHSIVSEFEIDPIESKSETHHRNRSQKATALKKKKSPRRYFSYCCSSNVLDDDNYTNKLPVSHKSNNKSKYIEYQRNQIRSFEMKRISKDSISVEQSSRLNSSENVSIADNSGKTKDKENSVTKPTTNPSPGHSKSEKRSKRNSSPSIDVPENCVKRFLSRRSSHSHQNPIKAKKEIVEEEVEKKEKQPIETQLEDREIRYRSIDLRDNTTPIAASTTVKDINSTNKTNMTKATTMSPIPSTSSTKVNYNAKSPQKTIVIPTNQTNSQYISCKKGNGQKENYELNSSDFEEKNPNHQVKSSKKNTNTTSTTTIPTTKKNNDLKKKENSNDVAIIVINKDKNKSVEKNDDIKNVNDANTDTSKGGKSSKIVQQSPSKSKTPGSSSTTSTSASSTSLKGKDIKYCNSYEMCEDGNWKLIERRYKDHKILKIEMISYKMI